MTRPWPAQIRRDAATLAAGVLLALAVAHIAAAVVMDEVLLLAIGVTP